MDFVSLGEKYKLMIKNVFQMVIKLEQMSIIGHKIEETA
jgi:hypothetical protein